MNHSRLKNLTISAMLVALSFILPYFVPPVVLPLWTMTLTAHVPIFISIFISPLTAAMTTLGTALAFFLKFPANFEVTLRAASHIVFVLLAIVLLKAGFGKKNIFQTAAFAIVISVVHALTEMLVIGIYLYLGIITNSNASFYLFVAVGLGSFVHSLIDFAIAFTIYKTLQKAQLVK